MTHQEATERADECNDIAPDNFKAEVVRVLDGWDVEVTIVTLAGLDLDIIEV